MYKVSENHCWGAVLYNLGTITPVICYDAVCPLHLQKQTELINRLINRIVRPDSKEKFKIQKKNGASRTILTLLLFYFIIINIINMALHKLQEVRYANARYIFIYSLCIGNILLQFFAFFFQGTSMTLELEQLIILLISPSFNIFFYNNNIYYALNYIIGS